MLGSLIALFVLLHTAYAQQPEAASINLPEQISPAVRSQDAEVPVFTAIAIGRTAQSNPPDRASVAVAGFRGSIPAMFYLSDQKNDPLTEAVVADFGIAAIGWNSLLVPKPLVIRMRSNLDYRLSVQASGLPDQANCAPGRTTFEISTCDIGFGVRTMAITGAGVVRPRQDTVPEKFNLTEWPKHSGEKGNALAFKATLHDITAADTPILEGTRISGMGDNGSPDNFIEVELGVALLPRFLTPGPFSGTVILTLAPQRP